MVEHVSIPDNRGADSASEDHPMEMAPPGGSSSLTS